MGIIKTFADGLVNIVANLGTSRDKAAHNHYVVTPWAPQQLEAIYRTSWLARAIIDYPAEDATRKWRQWRAEAKQITKIERLEKRLHLKGRVQAAVTAARLYGGAAIYLNTKTAKQELPLQVGKEEIRSLVVLTRNSLSPDPVVLDINSDYYGRPEFYRLTSGANAAQVVIHASRLVIFQGATVPSDPSTATVQQSWGDSVLQSTMDAVQQMDGTMANMASLVFEAKVDVLKFSGLASMLEDEGNDAVLARRLSTQAAMKGINGALVIDAEDDYEQKSANFAGLPDVVAKFMDAVAGASRIPVTRLYGRAAVGLSGSGDGDERVYFDRIGHIQATEIQPAMELLDECLIWQALGKRPEEIYFEWRPLRQLTETDRADIFNKTATAARSLAGPSAGELIPLDALSDALVNELTEQGMLPGLEQAVEEFGSLREQGLPAEGEEDPPATGAAPLTDAAPRPLYVSRKVLNAAEILAHYRKQGVGDLVAAADMHVTITYSRQPVNWMAMGEAWGSELVVNAGGARLMEAFGESKDTAVLAFVSSSLSWRHEEMVRAGATWDWPEYQPHVSISYAFTGDIDAIEPWRGEIKLGPEIFEALDENWSSKEGS
ncbi:anti-CBASS protein Acb1 family protein [Delftia acidovorans]|uniref:phage portal protein n=1 Tax=Delftia acidovorans TaxID=80866 RepID=UPI002FDCCE17